MNARRPLTRRRAIIVIAVCLYAVAGTSFAPYTWGIRVGTALPMLVVVATAVRRGWLRWRLVAPLNHRTWSAPAGYAGWVLVLGSVLTVQSLNYVGEPRAVYPTISSFGEQIFSSHGIRAAAFAAWMRLGWFFLDR